MIPASSGAGAFLVLFLLLQLAAFVAIVVGGIYFLSCMGRSARALERLTEISEAQFMQNYKPPVTPGIPTPPAAAVPPQVAPSPVAPTPAPPTSIEVSSAAPGSTASPSNI